MRFDVPKIEAEVYLIGEGSDGDPTALQAIKDWLRQSADECGCSVLYMDDRIAVIETPTIITIIDPESRKMIGLPPVDMPAHFREKDEN